MRRKNSSAHKLMAEVTSEMSEKLVGALLDMNRTNQELKRNEIEVNLQIYNE